MNPLTRLKLHSFYALGGLPPVRRLCQAIPGPGALLLYHRVSPLATSAARNHPMAINVVTPARFDEQMRWVKRHLDPGTLEDLREKTTGAGANSSAARLPVVVTFDDGHRDILEHALPVLERHRVPAILYITTGFMNRTASPWWLELWDLLEGRTEVSLAASGQVARWPLRTPAQHHQCYQDLAQRLQRLPLGSQAEVLAELRKGRSVTSHTPRFLSADEVRTLDRHPLITIGAHTQNHAALRAETEAAAREEMAGSKRVLENLLGHPVAHLAYPFGSPETAAEREFQLASECGFATAVTTRPEPFDGANWFRIPRHSVREFHTAARLRVKVSGWNARWRQSG